MDRSEQAKQMQSNWPGGLTPPSPQCSPTSPQPPQSEVSRALNDQDKVISMLGKVTHMLEDKLHPVLEVPTGGGCVAGQDGQTPPVNIAARLHINNQQIAEQCNHLAQLISRLQV